MLLEIGIDRNLRQLTANTKKLLVTKLRGAFACALAFVTKNFLVSRINITTFFNFPDMFLRYIRHLQCYIFEIAVEFKERAILKSSLHCVVNIAY